MHWSWLLVAGPWNFKPGHGLKQVSHLLIVHGFCVVQAVPTAKGQALADEFGIQFFETVRRIPCFCRGTFTVIPRNSVFSPNSAAI